MEKKAMKLKSINSKLDARIVSSLMPSLWSYPELNLRSNLYSSLWSSLYPGLLSGLRTSLYYSLRSSIVSNLEEKEVSYGKESSEA